MLWNTLILLRAAGRKWKFLLFQAEPARKITGIFPTDYVRACTLNVGRVCRRQIAEIHRGKEGERRT
jgi:hypothetical protein